MEVVALALLLLVAFIVFAIVAMEIIEAINQSRKNKKASCVVYIMRIDSSGNVELKKSPEQLWDWRF